MELPILQDANTENMIHQWVAEECCCHILVQPISAFLLCVVPMIKKDPEPSVFFKKKVILSFILNFLSFQKRNNYLLIISVFSTHFY